MLALHVTPANVVDRAAIAVLADAVQDPPVRARTWHSSTKVARAIGYLCANPDVLKTGMNPLAHFWLHGLAEGRMGWQKNIPAPDRKQLGRSRHADDFADIRRSLRAIEETMFWL